MKCRRHPSLWLYFLGIVFAIMLTTALISFLFIYTVWKFRDSLGEDFKLMFDPLKFIIAVSLVISTGLSLFVAKVILTPITEFSKASNEVAKGNFNIRLEEKSRIREISDLTKNFNTMIQELSSIETLRTDFVVNVSHEFKTPIAAIEGYAMLLRDKHLSESERDEYTKMIIESSRQLSALSGNILALSKLENQEAVPDEKAYRLDEQIRQAILLLEPEWSSKNLDMQIDLNKTTFYGSEHLLMQVWMNLIGNAIKFTPENGTIEITLYSENENTIIRISDTGCGMTDQVINHIFDKFYQGDTARKADGNGLGLSLAKKILDLCKAKIEVKSTPTKGSIFTVIL